MQERGMVLLTTYVTRAQREALQRLSARTRVRQSDYIREAINDLLAKYAEQPSAAAAGQETELGLAEAATRSGLSTRTLRRYLRAERLLGRKVGGRWLVDGPSLDRLTR